MMTTSLARASCVSGMCVLWLLIAAANDQGLCGEGSLRAQALEGSRTVMEPSASRDESLLVSQAVETTGLDGKPRLERGPEQVDTQRFDASPDKAVQSAQPQARKQVLEHNQEWDRAEALARALGSSLQGGLDAARSAVEAERIKQRQALEHADILAREVTSLRVELDTARAAAARAAEAAKTEQQLEFGKERAKAETLARELASAQKEVEERSALLASAHADALQAMETNSAEAAKRELALTNERDRAGALERELASLRAERDVATEESSKAVQQAENKQKQALDRERERAENLARELASVREDLDKARAAAETAESAKVEQERALGKERDKAEAVARELAAIRNEADARSHFRTAAHTEVTKEPRQTKLWPRIRNRPSPPLRASLHPSETNPKLPQSAQSAR